MDAIFSFNTLLIVNLSLLGALFLYLLTKIKAHPSVGYLVASLTPLIGFQLGCYLFTNRPTSPEGATLIVLGVALIPIAVTPVSHTLGRAAHNARSIGWTAYYGLQIVLLLLVLRGVFTGGIIEWVTGILDQPIIIIDETWRYVFINVVGASVLALFCFDRTLRDASKAQRKELKFVLIAFLGFAVYFSYISISVLVFILYLTIHGAVRIPRCLYRIGFARVWFRKVSFLGSKNTRFQAPRFWLPIGHRGSDLSRHFGKYPRHLTVDATPRFQCLGARGDYYSRFSFSIILPVAEFSQQHQRLHHEKFLS